MDQLNGVNPASFGVVVIVLLQLAQFFFAWKRSNHETETVRKTDLAAVRKELRLEIREVEAGMGEMRIDIEGKLDSMRKDAAKWREGISDDLKRIELKEGSASSATAATLEFIKQQVASLNVKVDKLNSKP